AFFPFAQDSPPFRFLDLTGAGLEWRRAEYESAHPARDGACVAIARDVNKAAATFGADADAWRRLAAWQAAMGPRLAEALLAPLPGLGAAWRLGPANLVGLARAGMSSSARYARRLFKTEAARRLLPALALHVDLGPNDFSGA